MRVVCLDCDLPYEAFPLDVVLPDEDWARLVGREDGSGLLCAACIAKRAAALPDVVILAARLVTVDMYDETDPPRRNG